MNAMKNRVQLIGNLGQDPELKQLEGGRTLAQLSVATSENYKNDQGERVTDTQWHRVIAWGKTAELMGQFLKRGSEVAIDGKLKYSNYEDNDGVKRYSTDIVASDFLLLGKREPAAAK